MMGIIGRYQCHGFHRTYIHTFSTAVTLSIYKYRYEIGGMHRIQNGKAPGGDHRFAAAAAAVADKIHPLAHILAKLHQIVIISLL